MLNCDFFYKQLRKNGINFFAGVPDSLLQDICAYLTDHTNSETNVITANEGGAIGMALGHYLATGKPGLVYMQNSGQGNTVNPLMSLADQDIYSIPMVLLVGWRGEPGHKDEPQHIKQGKITLELFKTMGIPCMVLPETEKDSTDIITLLIKIAISEKKPVALVVRQGTFAPYRLKNKPKNDYPLAREEAIGCIASVLSEKDIVVSTTGKASRELYEFRDRYGMGHAQDFLTVGGMGHASQIALGIALVKKKRIVCCIDGDGAILMHLGGMTIIATQKPENFKHVLLNNGVHDSVGGQSTGGFQIDFCGIAKAIGYRKIFSATSREELDTLLPLFMEKKGPILLEIRISSGARNDLGRPKTTPAQNKRDFMEFLHD